MLLILIMQSFVQKLAISESITFIKIIDELIVVFCVPYVIRVGLIVFEKHLAFKKFFTILVVYWLFGLFSSLFISGKYSQALYQFLLDSKYIIVFLYCYGAYREGKTEQYLERFFKFFILLNIPFVLLQLLTPSLYDSFFPKGAHTGTFWTDSGEQLARAAGIFWVTGMLAFFSSLSSGFFLISKWKNKNRKANSVYLILSLLLLSSTLSRGEIGAFLIAASITYLFFITNKHFRYVNLIFFSTILSGIIISNTPLIERSFMEMGLTENTREIPQPRAKMMSAAIAEANENFPLGAGLGTLGGQAAVIYDSDIFYKYGYQYVWYFNQGIFLTDTYWPKIFAETGWLSAIFLLYLYLFFPLKYLQNAKKLNFAGTYSFFSMLVMLINSFSAPVYNSAIMTFLVLFLIGFDNKDKST